MFDWLRRFFGSGAVVQKHPGMATVAAVPTSTAFWNKIEGSGLAQGDFLTGCFVPNFPPDFGANDASNEVQITKADLIVDTQIRSEERRLGQVCRAWSAA